jgi:catechol-2,3-dioxygenase
MPTARVRAIALDTRDPAGLARFYQQVLGGDVDDEDPEWVTLRGEGLPPLSFQLAPDHQPPEWPNPDKPQQIHLDLTVGRDQLDAAEAQVLAAGATKHAEQPGEQEGWRVYVDPAGHPFCFCWD